MLRGELDERDARAAARAARAAAEAAARRQGDRLVERADARRARAGAAALEPAVALGASSCSGRSRPPDGRLHRTWRDGVAKGTGYLEDYADVAYGLMELHVATRRPALAARGAPARDARGRAVRRRRRRRLLPDAAPTASSSSRARRSSTTIRRRAATRCSPTSCCGSARIWGDDELERRGVSVLRLVRDALAARADGVRLAARRARPAPRAAPRARDRRSARRAGRARGARAPRRRPTWSPSARPTTSRCSPGAAEVDGLPAVYLCERFACQLPVTDPAELVALDRRASVRRGTVVARRRAPARGRRPRAARRSAARRPPCGRTSGCDDFGTARRRLERCTERVADPEREHAEPGADDRARRRRMPSVARPARARVT